MATLSECRKALADVLNNNLKANVYPYVPGAVTAPAVVIEPAAGEIVTMGRGRVVYLFDVHVITAANDDVASQQVLDEYLTSQGPNSIIQVVADNKTLALDDTDASALEWGGYGTIEISGEAHLEAVMRVQIATSGRTN